jgi:enoyl-CoA hydratase
MTLDQGLRFETELSVILQSTEDRAEGLRAFFEKRPPKFEGR